MSIVLLLVIIIIALVAMIVYTNKDRFSVAKNETNLKLHNELLVQKEKHPFVLLNAKVSHNIHELINEDKNSYFNLQINNGYEKINMILKETDLKSMKEIINFNKTYIRYANKVDNYLKENNITINSSTCEFKKVNEEIYLFKCFDSNDQLIMIKCCLFDDESEYFSEDKENKITTIII